MRTEWDPRDYGDATLAELLAVLPKSALAVLITAVAIALLIVRFGT